MRSFLAGGNPFRLALRAAAARSRRPLSRFVYLVRCLDRTARLSRGDSPSTEPRPFMHTLFETTGAGVSLRSLLPLAFVALLSGGCALEARTAPDSEDTPIVTDRTSYTLERGSHGWETEIRVEYENRTNGTISLVNCKGAYSLQLERWDGGEWVHAWSPTLPMCLSPPIEIGASRTYSDQVRVFGGFPDNRAHFRFEVDEVDGTYRLVITSAYREYDHDGPPWGDEVPLEHRISNTFELRTR